MLDSNKMFQSLYAKGAISICNSTAISMTCQRRRATAYLLIPLHWRGGGEAGGVVSVCRLDQSFLKHLGFTEAAYSSLSLFVACLLKQ